MSIVLTTLVLVTALTHAQQTKAKIDSLPLFPVSGRVVNAKDGRPIAGAKVTVAWVQMHCTPFIGAEGEPVPDCALPPQYTPVIVPISTDNSGGFLFPAVPQGLIAVRAEAKGFFTESGRPDTLGLISLSAPAKDVTLRLLPAASLRGIVEDGTGRGLAKWEVALSSAKVYDQGFTTTSYNGSVQTDADGTFAFDGILPGDYFLTSEVQPAPSASHGESQIYPPLTWPVSVPGLSSPRTVHLESGEFASATLRVIPKRLYHVRGKFTTDAKTVTDIANASVTALPEYGGDTYLEHNNRADGLFDIMLPDGRFKILVKAPDTHAERIVEIAGSDVEGVNIALGPRVKIPVKINVPTASSGQRSSLLQQATFGSELMLAGEPDNGESFGEGTNVVRRADPTDAYGNTSFDAMVPGKYSLVTFVPPPWYVATISSGGHNLSVERYTITDQKHATTIDVELRADSGSVSGKVHQGEAPAPAFVYALPTFPTTSEPRTAIAQANGEYRLDALAPGSYRILAFDHEVAIPFREDISPWLKRGRPTTINSGTNAQLDLDLEPN